MGKVYKNFLGHPIDLVWTMHKINNPLSISVYPLGAIKQKKFFQFPNHLQTTVYDNGDLYFDKEEIAKISNFIELKINKNPKYPDLIFKRMQKVATQIKKQNIFNKRIEKLNLKQLINIFKKERSGWIDMVAFMSYRGSVQMAEVLEKQVKNIVTVKASRLNNSALAIEAMEIFTLPIKPSVIREEKLYLLNVAQKINQLNARQLNSAVNKYIEKFNWINYHWFVGKDFKYDEVVKKIKFSSTTAKYELLKIKKQELDNELRCKKIIKILKLNTAEINKARQLRTWIYARSAIKDSINLATYKLLPILYAIANKIGISPTDIIYLFLNEIDELAEQPKSEFIKLINNRKKSFKVGILNNKFVFEKIKINHGLSTSNQSSAQQLKGSTAMKGKVTGVARIILSPKEVNQIQAGEILVTCMTTPDFLPAMEKASAFVTDEGGITCHAAIVAREMNKPCIIGTKIATKLIKNGDRIEVDATNGVIKIIR